MDARKRNHQTNRYLIAPAVMPSMNRFRGQKKVQQQALMTAICQNMKKIANILAKKAG